MKELPVSDCLKEHYKKHNAVFTDSEQATIFWESSLPVSEKLDALRGTRDKCWRGHTYRRRSGVQERRDMDIMHLLGHGRAGIHDY